MFDIYPIKELLFTLFVIYLTIYFNYIRFDRNLEQFINTYPQIIYLLIFMFSMISMQFNKHYGLLTHIVFSSVIVAIFYATTALRVSHD